MKLMHRLLMTTGVAALTASTTLAQVDVTTLEDANTQWSDGGVRPGPAFTMRRIAPISATLPEVAGNTPTIVTEALPVAELLAEDALSASTPLRAGRVLAATSDSAQHGLWTPQADGSWVYTISFHTPGAKGMRISVPRWRPVGLSTITFFDPEEPTESWGPFGAGDAELDGSLVSPIVWGSHISIEYRVPAGVDLTSPQATLSTRSVTALYRSPAPPENPINEVGCHLDVNCYAAWNDISDSVAVLGYGDTEDFFFCSGAMMFQSSSNFRPVFATARHWSVNTPGEFASLLTIWRWESASCNGTVPNPATLDQVRGYAGLHVDGSSDWQLIGLRPEVPGYVWYAGWRTDDIPLNENVYGIHHPDGSHKRISFMSKNLNIGSLAPLDAGQSCNPSTQHLCLISSGNGRIEPGSSGSPLFTSDGAIRGVLSCGSAVSCASGNVQTASFGRLQLGFPLIGQFLQPQSTVWVQAGFTGVPRGTSSEPFDRVVQAGYGSLNNSTVNIRAGTYGETVTISFPMRIRAVGGTVRIGS